MWFIVEVTPIKITRGQIIQIGQMRAFPTLLKNADESTSYISINNKNYGPGIDPGNGTLDKYTGHQITPQFSNEYNEDILQKLFYNIRRKVQRD